MQLRDLGLDPASPETRKAIDLIREKSDWGPYHGHSPFFEGEVGTVHQRQSTRLRRLLRCGERPTGRPPSGRTTSGGRLELRRTGEHALILQFHSLRTGRLARIRDRKWGNSSVKAARLKGQEYLLERRLFKSLSTGEAIDRDRKSDRDGESLVSDAMALRHLVGPGLPARAGDRADKRAGRPWTWWPAKRQRNGRWFLG